MSEIRASHIGSEYDPDRSDPLLVWPDEFGVLRPFAKKDRRMDWVVRGNLKGYEDEDVIVVDPKVEHA